MNIDRAFLPPETFYSYQLMIMCYQKNVWLHFFLSSFTLSNLYVSFPLEALQTGIGFVVYNTEIMDFKERNQICKNWEKLWLIFQMVICSFTCWDVGRYALVLLKFFGLFKVSFFCFCKPDLLHRTHQVISHLQPFKAQHF